MQSFAGFVHAILNQVDLCMKQFTIVDIEQEL
jgi:hypothetical protein